MIGVQIPRQVQIPLRIKATLISHSGDGGMGNIIWILSTIREQPAARRNNRRPTPGLPVGKVEYKRCKQGPSKLPYLVTRKMRMTRRGNQTTALSREDRF